MVNQISDDTIELIRQANDVVDIVGEYVQLKKQGRNFFGLCPFHSENTPSFSVNQEKQIYHCFGCGKGGNVITFMMEAEGFTFQQAIQHLAEKSDQPIPQFNHANRQQYDSAEQSSLEAYQWLTKLYHHLLRRSKEGKEALQYLYDRGFTDKAIAQFSIGYAPTNKEFVVQFLEKKGYHRQVMAKSGLLTVNEDGQYFDRFLGRVIFPIRNHLGKTVGFGGRSITDQQPKYLNSPETSLFQKSKLLYNFDLARSSIRKEGHVTLFEGYADVIAAHQAGVNNGVATLGTTLTEKHAAFLRRYVDTVCLCYDADAAGQQATYKAINLLKKIGLKATIAVLPADYDPDQYIQEFGSEAFRQQVLDSSITEMNFLMNYFKKDFNLNLEGDRLRYVEKVIEEIALLKTSVERDYYVRELSQQFQLSYEALQQDLLAHLRKNVKKSDNPQRFGNTNDGKAGRYQRRRVTDLPPAYQNAERRLIAYMLQNAHITDKVKETIGSKFNLEQHQIIVTYLYGYYEEGNEPDPSHFLSYIDDPDIQQKVVELSMIDCSWEMSENELRDYIRTIQLEQKDNKELKKLRQEQKILEKTDPVEAAKIGMRIIEIKQQSKN